MENEQKPLMDRIWDEMTSFSGPVYKAELKTGKPNLEPPFLGRVSSASFKRKHPAEHNAVPDEQDLTMDDWTVCHD